MIDSGYKIDEAEARCRRIAILLEYAFIPLRRAIHEATRRSDMVVFELEARQRLGLPWWKRLRA